MAKIQYSFKLSNTLSEQIHEYHYITLPVKYNYAVGFTAYLKNRPRVIFDQITLKTLHLEDPVSSHFDVTVRKYLEAIKSIEPDLAFIPAFHSKNHGYSRNIEITREIHGWFNERYDMGNLAGLILGDEPDEWIEWIRLCWGKDSWGVLTSNNLKAVELLMREAGELKHVHLFENNWLLHQESLKRFEPLTINTITFDGNVYSFLKATKQTVQFDKPNLIIRQGSLDVNDFIETIEKFLRA